MPKHKHSKLWLVVGCLVLLNIAVWVSVWKARPRDFVSVHFLDVGQGDAIYLRTPEGSDVLVDGGPGEAVLAKLGQIMPLFDRSIEFLVLTHPHADHLTGLVEVLKRYQVQKVLVSEVVYNSASYNYFLDLLRAKHIPVVAPKLGERIFLDRQTVFDVYYPIAGAVNLPDDLNDVSTVGKISFGQSHILLTGDAGTDVERLLLALRLPLAAQILKVGHHGSSHSTSPEFLQAASSTIDIISVGQNSFGHPNSAVLQELSGSGGQIYRTDQDGDISFRIYPDRIERIL